MAKLISPEGETFLYAGQGLDLAGTATLEFADKTRIELGPGTLIKEVRVDPKRVVLDKGTLRAEVEKQPQGKPMVFATPHGEATVLGTILRIIVDPDPKKGTRLDVEEGRVQLRKLGGKPIDVMTGHYAVAAAGVELVSLTLPIEDIVLYGSKARWVGAEWRVTPDDQAFGGRALEAYLLLPSFDGSEVMLKKRLAAGSFAEFTFPATANLEYSVWIRGRTMSTPPEHHDALYFEFAGAQYNTLGRSLGHVLINGWGNRGTDVRYWWLGAEDDKPENAAFLTVKFPKSGRQILRIYGVETPMRIDSIWLSTTQKTRPADTQRGPK